MRVTNKRNPETTEAIEKYHSISYILSFFFKKAIVELCYKLLLSSLIDLTVFSETYLSVECMAGIIPDI